MRDEIEIQRLQVRSLEYARQLGVAKELQGGEIRRFPARVQSQSLVDLVCHWLWQMLWRALCSLQKLAA